MCKLYKAPVTKGALELRGKFLPITITQQVYTSSPEESRKALVKMARNEVTHQDVQQRLVHAATLHSQGNFLEFSWNECATIWSRAVQSSLPQYWINAAQDTLSNNVNLAL